MLHLTRTSRVCTSQTPPLHAAQCYDMPCMYSIRCTYLDPETWALDSGVDGRTTILRAYMIRLCLWEERDIISVSTQLRRDKPYWS